MVDGDPDEALVARCLGGEPDAWSRSSPATSASSSTRPTGCWGTAKRPGTSRRGPGQGLREARDLDRRYRSFSWISRTVALTEALNTRERRRPSAPLLAATCPTSRASRRRSPPASAATACRRLSPAPSAEDREVIGAAPLRGARAMRIPARRWVSPEKTVKSLGRTRRASGWGGCWGRRVQGDPRQRDDVAKDADEERALRRSTGGAIGRAHRLRRDAMRSVRERAPGGGRLSGTRPCTGGDKNPEFWGRLDRRRGAEVEVGSMSSRKLLLGIAAVAVIAIGYFAVNAPRRRPRVRGHRGRREALRAKQTSSSKDVKLDNRSCRRSCADRHHQRLFADKAAVAASFSNASFRLKPSRARTSA